VKSGSWHIHISPDEICPSCKEVYVTVGKHLESRYYCNSDVQVPPGKTTPIN
jgi:hypothetical protein